MPGGSDLFILCLRGKLGFFQQRHLWHRRLKGPHTELGDLFSSDIHSEKAAIVFAVSSDSKGKGGKKRCLAGKICTECWRIKASSCPPCRAGLWRERGLVKNGGVQWLYFRLTCLFDSVGSSQTGICKKLIFREIRVVTPQRRNVRGLVHG